MQDDFVPLRFFSNTKFDTVSNNNDSNSDDVFFQLQETGNAEYIIPITPIKESFVSQQLNSDKRDYFRQ